MLDLLVLLIAILVPILLLAELLTVLIYGIVLVWRVFLKGGNIRKAKEMNDVIFDAKARTVSKACEPVEAVLRIFEHPQEL